MPAREVEFADQLAAIMRNVIAKTRFDGFEIVSVRRGFQVTNKETDIALMSLTGPLIFVETKRKEKNATGSKYFSCFDSAVIGQAISYCALYEKSIGQKVPYFVTAIPKSYAVFKTPERLLDFVDLDKAEKREYDKAIKPGKLSKLFADYLLKSGELRLRDEFIEALLNDIVKDYLKIHQIKAQLTHAIIGVFNDFVDAVSTESEPTVILEANTALKPEIANLESETASSLVERDDSGRVVGANVLTRMMTYVLLNKLVFYNVLEGRYRALPRLVALGLTSATQYLTRLNEFIKRAVDVTGDFEPIFNTGIFDKFRLPDDPELLRFIDRFIEMLDAFDMTEVGELSGYSYESIIPAEERHRLGQFYTPPAVAELIAKWCIRGPDDKILDPGVGSGTFVTAAYREVSKQKTGRDVLPVSSEIHNKILGQLFAVDINPFPLQLASMSLAMKNVSAPSTEINTMLSDFFSLNPNQKVFAPYVVRTPAGDIRRSVVIPEMDVVMGNPPYTRWTEMTIKSRQAVSLSVGGILSRYNLRPGAVRSEPMIFVHFVMQGSRFLKNGGRLGMIVSNLWMQTDYGVKFGEFLLDNFKVKVIIDFTLRLFNALISTCILLLERETDKKQRELNDTIFIYIPGEVEAIDVTEMLETIKTRKSDNYLVNVLKQRDIPVDKKWVDTFLGMGKTFKSPLLTKMSDFFEVARGNLKWSFYALQNGARPDPGSSDFHYLTPSKVKDWSMTEIAYPKSKIEDAIIWPAITSSRQPKTFIFEEKDWKKLARLDSRAYIFVGHKKRTKLPKAALEYVSWGETECKTKIRGTRGGGRLASETDSAKSRTRAKEFFGWYDLGGVRPALLFAIYQAWWKTRFVWCQFPLAMYHGLVSFIPKVKLNDLELKALLAYLNSSFTQQYVETNGRRSGGGIIGLEVNVAQDMPVLDTRKLSEEQIQSLAKNFDELEAETRKIGGATEKEQIHRLNPIIDKIDQTISELLGLTQKQTEEVQKNVKRLVERRVSSAGEAKPDSVKGNYQPRIKMPTKRKKQKDRHHSEPLDLYF